MTERPQDSTPPLPKARSVEAAQAPSSRRTMEATSVSRSGAPLRTLSPPELPKGLRSKPSGPRVAFPAFDDARFIEAWWALHG